MKHNRIGGVMVSVFESSAVDRGFEHQSGQTKYYKLKNNIFHVISQSPKQLFLVVYNVPDSFPNVRKKCVPYQPKTL
jgi:hypothetical protein